MRTFRKILMKLFDKLFSAHSLIIKLLRLRVANNFAMDIANCALLGKVMQGSPCPEVRTLTNEKWEWCNTVK